MIYETSANQVKGKEEIKQTRGRINTNNDIEFLNSQIDLVCHATESKSKILDSIFNVLLIPQQKFQETEYEGHWGNKIITLSTTMNKKESFLLIKKILGAFSFMDRDVLLKNLQIQILMICLFD